MYNLRTVIIFRAIQKMKAMSATLSKASRLFPDCSAMVKKLRAMTYNAEEQLRAQKNQASFLENLAGRTTPKGLHCLSMRLTTEYFALQTEEQKLPNQHKFQNPDLHHFAVFSDNVLACSAVVNSTVSTARVSISLIFLFLALNFLFFNFLLLPLFQFMCITFL